MVTSQLQNKMFPRCGRWLASSWKTGRQLRLGWAEIPRVLTQKHSHHFLSTSHSNCSVQVSWAHITSALIKCPSLPGFKNKLIKIHHLRSEGKMCFQFQKLLVGYQSEFLVCYWRHTNSCLRASGLSLPWKIILCLVFHSFPHMLPLCLYNLCSKTQEITKEKRIKWGCTWTMHDS